LCAKEYLRGIGVPNATTYGELRTDPDGPWSNGHFV
jgi:hypothetical protein